MIATNALNTNNVNHSNKKKIGIFHLPGLAIFYPSQQTGRQ